jgi:hypothetical protein
LALAGGIFEFFYGTPFAFALFAGVAFTADSFDHALCGAQQL